MANEAISLRLFCAADVGIGAISTRCIAVCAALLACGLAEVRGANCEATNQGRCLGKEPSAQDIAGSLVHTFRTLSA